MPNELRLGVNIDHVATIRNARGSAYPDPVRAAKLEIDGDDVAQQIRELKAEIERLKKGNSDGQSQ